MNSVLKDKEIADKNNIIDKTRVELDVEKKAAIEAKKEKLDVIREKDQIEKQKEKLAAQDKKEADADEKDLSITAPVRFKMLSERSVDTERPAIGPITHNDDRQKGRFGGKSQNNGRKISAIVNRSGDGIYYPFSITVESIDPLQNPLHGEVIFFLHDSFTPSVHKVTVEDGKAVYKNSAYGAFTVGAVADNGKTLLELDLAEDVNFPREFRER